MKETNDTVGKFKPQLHARYKAVVAKAKGE
jgi:hypothetical protein